MPCSLSNSGVGLGRGTEGNAELIPHRAQWTWAMAKRELQQERQAPPSVPLSRVGGGLCQAH